jgi:Subtilase family
MNKIQFSLLILFLFSFNILTAQQKEAPVRFANGDFVTHNNISSGSFKKGDIDAAIFEGSYYVLVQFAAIPGKDIKDNLKRSGIDLNAFLPGNAYLAIIKNSFDFNKARLFNIVSVNAVPAIYKIDRRLLNYKNSTDREQAQVFAVSYFESVDREKVRQALVNSGAIFQSSKYDNPGMIFIQANPSIINKIAELPFISGISLQYLKDKPINYNSRAMNGVSALSAANGKNLNGKGVTVGIGDNADISTHIDFSGRLINRSPWLPDVHGTHTAGTTGGAGIINVKYQGMAPRATLINQLFSDIILNTPAYITDYDMVLTNNSYHSSQEGCPGTGDYDALSNYADKQLVNNPQLLHVFASGNDGANTCSPYPAQFATVKSGWQVAKNVLTVGAIQANNYLVAGFSSRGPVKDGRIKPEIMSSGVSVQSTYPNNSYGNGTGTSMACPGVTGSLALLYERYRQLHSGADPKGALIKAIACNTAEDLGNAGPDYSYGFGLINARRGVESIDSNRYFINSIPNAVTGTHNITIPANTRRVKIMLYWADPAAVTSAGAALVNDLDLVVLEPSFTLHRPLVLNTAAASVNNLAAEGADHLNNIEQVTIENPAAGVYTASVNGISIPSGPQEYIITYEIVRSGVTVEYPYGGEKLVPGESEIIRWNAYGNEANTFTIDYSVDNGANWVTVNNNVPSTTRIYTWSVPATVTNTALIRVSRNGTALSGQSNFNFSVLEQPIITATNACEGSAQLNWSAISSATSYDILQLDTDTMKVIGNTATNSYLITGLNKNTSYWFGVAAKNATVAGRRSVSRNVLPNSGPCTLAAFDNDLKVDSILEPTTARQLFSNAANATKPVKVLIKNNGSIAVSGPYDVSFSYGGGSVTETVNTTINAGGSTTYTFAGTYPVVAAGYEYPFKAWITKSTDGNHLNDTAYKTVKYINNDAIAVLPLSEDFESMPAGQYVTRELAIGGNKYLDFSSSRSKGRARTFVNSGMAFGGTQALTLDQLTDTSVSNTDSAVLNYNLSLFNNSQLRFDFYYKNHGQANFAGNKIWIRGSETNNWIQAFDLYGNQADLGDWKKGIININDLLSNANPTQTVTPTFQIKIGQQGYFSANAVNPVVDIDDGYTFDNLQLSQAINDVAVLDINSPGRGDCALTAANPVSIKLKNYNNAVLNNLQVSYQVNGGTVVTENIASIAANQSLDYVFTQKANLSAYIDYNINVWVKYASDNYAANDSILDYSVHNSFVVSNYPYLESFETNNGGFYSKGTNSSWQWGTPAKTIINKAPNGSKAWVTSLAGTYSNNETSYLISPCFDLSTLTNPVLSFSHAFDIEEDYDYTWVEYSTDGKNWLKLGNVNSGTNWYDNAAFNNWSVSKTKWHVASIDLPVTGSNIRFRFVMSSDGGVSQEGIGIDDVHVHEKYLIAGNPGNLLTSQINNASGNGWKDNVYGSAPGYIYAEVNPNGQNLGTLQLAPLKDLGAVKFSNNQYYLGRNFSIHPSILPTDTVDLRLYFTDSEVNSMINATTCPTCVKLNDAYELGITNYTGNLSEENLALDDNLDGYYNFIVPGKTSIVPFGSGYYAAFSVTKFGEFWISKNSIAPANTNLCPGSTITLSSNAGAAAYQWQVNTGTAYTNITNGTGYAGATTSSLQIINLSTSFTGYRYRCVADGVNGTEYTLRFKNTWTGATSTNWFTSTNWSCGSVPDDNTDVIIPSGLARYPILTANTEIRSLRMLTNVPVIINTGVQLDINGR